MYKAYYYRCFARAHWWLYFGKLTIIVAYYPPRTTGIILSAVFYWQISQQGPTEDSVTSETTKKKFTEDSVTSETPKWKKLYVRDMIITLSTVALVIWMWIHKP